MRVYCFETDYSSVVQPPPWSAATQRVIWISDGAMTPKLGGSIADFDVLCQTEAMAAGLPTPYTLYQALLPPSTTVSAMSRFDTSSAALPWARKDGVVVAAAADLGTGALIAPIQVSLTGSYVGSGGVWSGGTADPSTVLGTIDCNDWTSNSHSLFAGQGYPTTMARFWIGGGGQQYCDASLNVICAQK
jgi:hypothetical protein